MKLTTFFRIIGVGALCLWGQFSYADYVPMLEQGKSWRHNIHGAMSGTVADWTLKLEQETEIDGQKWFVMNSYVDGVASELNPLCYLREDTTEQKVWVKMGENGDFSWSHLIASFGNATTDYALYDFKNYSQMIATLSGGQDYHIGGFKEGDVDGYPGQAGDNLAVVQGLGLVPVGVTKENAFFECHASSFLGLPAYHDSNDNIYPFLYAVEDGQGERIFEAPLLDAAAERYKPFVETGKTWRYKLSDDYCWTSEDGKKCPDDQMEISIGPSMADAEEWHPLYLRQQSVNPEEDIEPYGYVREDLSSKKVYWKANENVPYEFSIALNQPCYNILYDFGDANNPETVWPVVGAAEGWFEAEGARYNGFMLERLVLAERIGLVEKLETKNYEGSTILGVPELPAGGPGYLFIPYIYEITDGEGNILYQKPQNRPSASLDDKLRDAMAISVAAGRVSFSGEAGIPLEITNMQGIAVWSGSTDAAGHALSASLARGAYVVKHGTGATKVLVK